MRNTPVTNNLMTFQTALAWRVKNTKITVYFNIFVNYFLIFLKLLIFVYDRILRYNNW